IGNPHQLGGLLEGEWPEEQRVDHAEDGGAGANTKPGDQDRKDGKAGVAAHASKGVTDILEEVREDHGRPLDERTVRNVARWSEYGLPAVANVKHATRRLRTGERIKLDAFQGRIVRVQPKPEEAAL
ncbi:MAG TPA: hypothetical protein VGC23_04345, partial [Vicinamibacterales bacterium]